MLNLSSKHNCKQCNKQTINPVFCSSNCAATFNNSHRLKTVYQNTKIKPAKCKKCQKDIYVNIRSSINVLCDKCNSENILDRRTTTKLARVCKCCGRVLCKEHLCKWFQSGGKITFEKLGGDLSVVGTQKILFEFVKIKELIIDSYLNKKISINEIRNTYDIYLISLELLFNCLNIKRRNLSESRKMFLLTHPDYIGSVSKKYKSGHHISWNGKDVFYRSSYEQKYCEYLDSLKINYEVEKIRILYWDSQLQKFRIAIPDFYLPDQNKIIEIKSDYTYNKQNMLDKAKTYIESGYKFELVLDHKNYEFSQMP